MNNSKNLFGIIIFSMIFIVSCIKDSEKVNLSSSNEEIVEIRTDEIYRSTCNPNYNSGTIPAGCEDITYCPYVNLEHPMYTGCIFTVRFCFNICRDFNPIKINLVDAYKIVDHNCPQFTADLNDPFKISGASTFLIDFERRMLDAIINRMITDPFKHFNDAPPNFNNILCSEGSVIHIHYTRGSCINYQVWETKDKSYLGADVCGAPCCEVRYEVCKKSDGTYQITKNTITVLPSWPVSIDFNLGYANSQLCWGDGPILQDYIPPVGAKLKRQTGCLPSCL